MKWEEFNCIMDMFIQGFKDRLGRFVKFLKMNNWLQIDNVFHNQNVGVMQFKVTKQFGTLISRSLAENWGSSKRGVWTETGRRNEGVDIFLLIC